jgi:hypothetical protein
MMRGLSEEQAVKSIPVIMTISVFLSIRNLIKGRREGCKGKAGSLVFKNNSLAVMHATHINDPYATTILQKRRK